MSQRTLVSCLCVSFQRVDMLRNAINYFKAQTYTDRELIIVSLGHDPLYEHLISSQTDCIIKYFSINERGSLTLGELRNIAIEKATGKYICVWDDDDWYHNRRIELQMQETLRSKKKGTILPYCILYNSIERKAFMSIIATPPASIFCEKAVINKELLYPHLNFAEDAAFMKKLFHKSFLYPVINPILYVYKFHGSNSIGLNHFNSLCSHEFSPAVNKLICNVIDHKFTYEEASEIMSSKKVLVEIDYFKSLITSIN